MLPDGKTTFSHSMNAHSNLIKKITNSKKNLIKNLSIYIVWDKINSFKV